MSSPQVSAKRAPLVSVSRVSIGRFTRPTSSDAGTRPRPGVIQRKFAGSLISTLEPICGMPPSFAYVTVVTSEITSTVGDSRTNSLLV